MQENVYLLFTITNCEIVHSRSLIHRIYYKYIDNEQLLMSA